LINFGRYETDVNSLEYRKPFNLKTLQTKRKEKLLTSVAIVPVYAGGGQNNGDLGQGTVGQGELGDGNSPGDDAQGNQAD